MIYLNDTLYNKIKEKLGITEIRHSDNLILFYKNIDDNVRANFFYVKFTKMFCYKLEWYDEKQFDKLLNLIMYL